MIYPACFSMLLRASGTKMFRVVAVGLILAVPFAVATRRAHAENKTDGGLDSQLEREYRRQLFRKAAELVRSRAEHVTWQAFAITMIDGLSISDAAAQLDRSEAVIYAARSRIIRRLRDAVKQMENESDLA